MIGDYKDNKDKVELIREFSLFITDSDLFQALSLVSKTTQSILGGSEVDPRYGVK